MSKTLKILLVDDHQIVLDGLKSLIETESEFRIIATANDGKQALEVIQNLHIDVVVMDLDMPEMTGIDVLRQLRAEENLTKVLILSMHNEEAIIQEINKIGGNAYMLKNASRLDLIDGIKKVANGCAFFGPNQLEKTVKSEVRNGDSSGLREDTLLLELTEREKEILRLVAEGMSNKEIGDALFISHRTVDTHRTNLMKKLDIHNIAGLIRFAIKSGIAG